MVRTAGRLVSRLVGLAGLVVVAWVGWRWGDAVFPRVEERLGIAAEVEVVEDLEASEAVGAAALLKIEDFLEGDQEELVLTGTEITSLLRYTRPEFIPVGVDNPTVRVIDGRAYASADVALADFPALPDLGPIAGMLPEVVNLELKGSIMGFGDGDAALMVQGIEVAGFPLPRGTIPEVLNALGRTDRGGLPPEAVAIDLPSKIESAHIAGEHLVLVGAR